MIWIIKDVLAHSEYPFTEELDNLYEKGIKAIVSLEKRYDKAIIKEKGFEYLEVYVKDFTAPTIDQLIRINEFIDSMINEKKPVLIHCIAGGRSGTALVAYLISQGESLHDALEEVRTKVSFAVDDPSQEEILQLFEMVVREFNSKGIKISENELEKAKSAYQNILDHLVSISDQLIRYGRSRTKAAIYHQLGMVAQEQKQFDEAIKWYKKALKIRERLELEQYVAAIYHQLGMVAQEQKQFDEAIKWYKKALKIRERLELDREFSDTSFQLGMVAQEQKQFDEAIKWYKKALKIRERLELEQYVAAIYHQLGMVAQEQKQFDEAIKWYKKALKIRERLELDREFSDTSFQLGMVAQEQKQFDEAIKWYKKALKIRERLELEQYGAAIYHQLGMVAQEQKQLNFEK